MELTPTIDYLDILNDRINYCHLKGWFQYDDGTWQAAGVGNGTMDWKVFLSKMKFDGVYLIEYEPTHDILDGIKRSIEYLVKIIPDLRFE